MKKIRYFFKQLKFVKFKDILSVFLFLIALPLSLFYKIRHKNLWLICERANEARDNGYWFYKYMVENHHDQEVAYAIKFKSFDYEKVKALKGKIIKFGSLKHWIYYLIAKVNISSQKEGKPNAALCHFLEIYGLIKNKRVNLQHGVIHNDLKWLYYDVTKMWLFVSTTRQEFNYCLKTFGYPEKNMALTGLCRYDNLDDDSEYVKNQVLIMPTHRSWLSRPVKKYKEYDDIYNFENTEYYKSWKKFLSSENLVDIVRKKNLDIILFLHPNMQKYTKYFSGLDGVRVVTSAQYDLQYLLKSSAVMITDYSSVAFDFAYMNKPLLYFQFDYDKFREGHYQEGYFSYEKNGFGPVCYDVEHLTEEFCRIVENEMEIENKYSNKIKEFFEYRDKENCKRTYEAILDRLRNDE